MKPDKAIEILASCASEAHSRMVQDISGHRFGELEEAFEMGLAALHSQQAARSNNPLTLNKLLRMQGQPVWINYTRGGWGLVQSIQDETITFRLADGDCICIRKEYLENWVAYSAPPSS